MMNNRLKIDERRKKIVDYIAMKGEARVTELSEKFQTTDVTIRSDLAALEASGYLKKIYGGAVHNTNNFYNTNFIQRNQQNAELKSEVGKKVAKYINDGETLFINSGATTYFAAIALKELKNLSIVTNSITIAVELGSHIGFNVILLGGSLNPQYAFTYGMNAIEQLRKYKADVSILSIDGIHIKSGYTTYHADEAVIDQEMVLRSRRCIIASDHTKFGHESFSKVVNAQGSTIIVTNDSINPQIKEQYKASGFNIVF